MSAEIHLENKFFPWKKNEGNNLTCWLKGNLFLNNKIVQGSDIISLLSSLGYHSRNDNDTLIKLLQNCNGSFALVIETPDQILGIVDRIRSIPLFYSKTESDITLSDDANYLRDQNIFPLNENTWAEFLVTGYVTGYETLFEGIQQLQAGEFLTYSKLDRKCSTHDFFQYLHNDYSDETEEQLLKYLDDVMVSVFNRLIDTTIKQGRTIVVPLSGGLDSRLIVAMLKRLGVNNIICFSYGKPGNQEAEISKKVAEALGYQWHFVEYSDIRWYNCYQSNEMRDYELYAGNLVSVPVIQDFLAVKILKEEGKIPVNSVFVPGHSGDMLAGSWIPEDIDTISQNFNQFIDHTLRRHYSLSRWFEKDENKLKKIFQNRIKKNVDIGDVNDSDSLVNLIEYFNFKERQAKFIVNSVRAYEFFGYEWRIPLWDAELMNFFLNTRLELRIKQRLYVKYCLNRLFIDDLSILKTISNDRIIKSTSKKFATKILNFFTKFTFMKKIGSHFFISHNIRTEYTNHPLNFYAIMSKEDFLKFYTGYENINTYLTKKYLERTLMMKK